MAGGVDKEIFRLEIPVDVAKLVECIHAAEHLSDVEARVPIVENSSIVQKGAEIASWDIFLKSVLAYASLAVHGRLTMAR